MEGHCSPKDRFREATEPTGTHKAPLLLDWNPRQYDWEDFGPTVRRLLATRNAFPGPTAMPYRLQVRQVRDIRARPSASDS